MDQPTQEIGLGEEILGTVAWETSEPFIGQWRKLVSTTNWEKGRIISEWRYALQAADAPTSEYSDEAWSRLAGGVTPQHVGRLRRVHERFANVRENYAGLFWSHFFAAVEWEDAEMWLEGAVQSSWSVSKMRRQRWETLGEVAAESPLDDEIVASEPNEDIEASVIEPTAKSAKSTDAAGGASGSRSSGERGGKEGRDRDDHDDVERPETDSARDGASIYSDESPQETITFVQPFADLAELPADITEAFEAFKIAILRHKLDGWREVTRDDVLASLDALKELAKTPSPGADDEASF